MLKPPGIGLNFDESVSYYLDSDNLDVELINLNKTPEFTELARIVRKSDLKEEKLFEHSVIVVEFDYAGLMPLHWMTRSDFEKSKQIIEQIDRGEGWLCFDNECKIEFRDKILDAFKLLFTRPTSRNCVFEIVEQAKHANRKIWILKHSQSEALFQSFFGIESELYLCINLKDRFKLSCSFNEDSIVPIDIPMHIILIHELIHLKHNLEGMLLTPQADKTKRIIKLLATSREVKYENGSYTLPKRYVQDTNWEERRTIMGLPGCSESINRYTENQVRKEFGLPLRCFHMPFTPEIASSYSEMETTTDKVDQLLIALCRNEEGPFNEILKSNGNNISSLVHNYFFYLKNEDLSDSVNKFSSHILQHLNDEQFYDRVFFHNSGIVSFQYAILNWARNPEYLKGREGLAVLFLLRLLWDTPRGSEIENEVLQTLDEVVKKTNEIPFEELNNPILDCCKLFFAMLKRDDALVQSILQSEECADNLSYFIMIIGFCGEKWPDRDPFVSKLLTMTQNTNLMPFKDSCAIESSYWRELLLIKSKDPLFVQGREKGLREFWKNVLELAHVERCSGDKPESDISTFPAWKEKHLKEIETIFQTLS